VEQQIRDGLIEEARRVVEMGFDPGLPPLAGLVYREAIAVVQDRMTLADATRRMKETTHAFARRQYTWLRRDTAITWFELGPSLEEDVTRAITAYLEPRTRRRASAR
jgi:tRNA dimethylallyltransferase